ncbi:DMT family transporter [Undibacterium sp. TJN25]|uniref:DMT family transporter n=1 Tax=Undibacterium sp. TJN25 TaxID=3413056 RepID=UPI003BF3CBB7
MSMTRKNLDGLAITLMLLLCVCWGLQQVAVKLAAPIVSSSMQIGLRSGLAALMVYALILVRGIPFSLRDGTLLPGLAAGALFAFEFLCVAIGLNFTSASHMSVFLYTAPVFTVIGLHWLIPSERMHASQWLGIVSAFAGMAVAFSGAFVTSSKGLDDPHLVHMLVGDGLGVLGGILWAATTVTIRKSKLSEAEPTTTLLYQLAGAAAILLAYACSLGESMLIPASPLAWGSILFQTVVVAFASYLTWFWLLRHYLASRLSVFSFLTPLFGVAAGVLFLHDAISPRFAAGACLVLAGIVLVNRRP